MSNEKRIEVKDREYVYAIRRKIAEHRADKSFPKPEGFNVTEDIVDDYLYEVMDGPQSIEEQKKVYTRYGICFVVPIAIVALMKQSMQNFIIGVAAGLLMCGCYYLLHRTMRNFRMKKLANSGVVEYIEAIENF